MLISNHKDILGYNVLTKIQNMEDQVNRTEDKVNRIDSNGKCCVLTKYYFYIDNAF